jgi:ubiquinone/menaquinone biosynthesis C-methylase UbiE
LSSQNKGIGKYRMSLKKDAIQLERENGDKMANRYNRDYHEAPILQSHSQAFVDYISQYIEPNDRVLDLGCASASLWKLFKERFPSSVSIVGVDLSPKMLDEARIIFPHDDFRIGSMMEIPAASGDFDVVIVSSAFHHINDALLPTALNEINRVMDEHGLLLGREPLCTRRLGDRGGWIAGALMNLRHMSYRLSHTREYPEPDPGPDHHAYDVDAFLSIIGNTSLTITDIKFRNPISLFLARSHNKTITAIAKILDDVIGHKEGQELWYMARKNFADTSDITHCIRQEINNNYIEDIPKLLAYIQEASTIIERELENDIMKSNKPLEKKWDKNKINQEKSS